MKKLILFLMLLSGIIVAQTRGVTVGDGVIWTKTLKFGTSAVRDSVWILPTNFAYDWFRIFIKGNSNSPVDSIGVKAGTIRYNQAQNKVDTVWGSYSTLKDSSWGNVNLIINNTVGKDYTLFNPVVQLLRFKILNNRAVRPTRSLEITVQALKPR